MATCDERYTAWRQSLGDSPPPSDRTAWRAEYEAREAEVNRLKWDRDNLLAACQYAANDCWLKLWHGLNVLGVSRRPEVIAMHGAINRIANAVDKALNAKETTPC